MDYASSVALVNDKTIGVKYWHFCPEIDGF